MAGLSVLEAYSKILATPSARQLYRSGESESLIDLFERVYGKSTVLYNQDNTVNSIITGIGQTYSFDTAAGASSQYYAGNALITDATYDVATNSVTANFGNIVSASGEVTKKGLMATASTGAKVMGGALAALGAVATGVNWYRDNPEFWTDVSQKLLPFAYKDPTDKSWGDIFYDALCPTAVDSDGTTYVPADMMQLIADTLYQNGFFDVSIPSYTIPSDSPDIQNWPSQYKNLTVHAYKGNNIKYNYSGDVRNINILDNDGDVYFIIFARNASTNDVGLTPISAYPFNIQDYSYDSSGGIYKATKYTNPIESYGTNIGFFVNDTYPAYFIPTIERTISGFSGNGDEVPYLMYYILNGIEHSGRDYDNTELENGATYPNGTPISERYPDWFKNAQTTVNPNWQPDKPESSDNPKYITWLPVQMPSNDTPDGDTEPDTNQDTAQKGKPTPNPSVDPTTDSAITDGVIPDPYPDPEDTPSLNPDPQPNPSPDPAPEPTDPSDPTSVPTPDPTPGVPSIGGGSANALWKIYNPSQAILQQFGAWLWSDNPLELIKQIFSNSPAEGVVGLHMIYVKPQIGGTANIKVGYLDSGVASPWVSQQYVSFDCGSVTVPLAYQSALDFGYTKVYCYLPFIGIVPLDSFDIIGKTVSIKYTVDVLTGAVLAQISVSSGNYNAVLYTFNGSCSVEYPLTAGTRASQLLALVTGAVGGAVVGGVGGAIIGGVRGAATGADVRMSGNLSGNAGAMGIRKPYLIVKRPVEVAARSYNSFYGYPANITGLLSSFSGYTRVKSAHVENITRASDAERDMIMDALRDGVIV